MIIILITMVMLLITLLVFRYFESKNCEKNSKLNKQQENKIRETFLYESMKVSNTEKEIDDVYDKVSVFKNR